MRVGFGSLLLASSDAGIRWGCPAKRWIVANGRISNEVVATSARLADEAVTADDDVC